MLERGDAPLELLVRVGWHLDLNGLEADAEMLELIVVFMKLLLADWLVREGAHV